MILDGKQNKLNVDGEDVGKIKNFITFDGTTAAIKHRPLAGPSKDLAGVPEFGKLSMTIWRDLDDPGQTRMLNALLNQQQVQCILTLSDGKQIAFEGCVTQIPIVGSSDGLTTALAVIKVSGLITPV